MIPSGMPMFLDSDFVMEIIGNMSATEYDVSPKDCFIDSVQVGDSGWSSRNDPQIMGFPSSSINYGSGLIINFVVANVGNFVLSTFHKIYESQFNSKDANQIGLSWVGIKGKKVKITFESTLFANGTCAAYLFKGVKFGMPQLTGQLNSKGQSFLRYSVHCSYTDVDVDCLITGRNSVLLDRSAAQAKNIAVFNSFKAAMAATQASLANR